MREILKSAVILLGMVLYCIETFAQQYYPALPPVKVMSSSEFTSQSIQDIPDSLVKSAVSSLKMQMLIEQSQMENNQTVLSTATIRISNGMLINRPHPWSPLPPNEIYVVNAQKTWGYLGKRLFSDNVHMDIEGLYIDNNPNNTISFQLDHYWNRIVYSQKSGNWIKSYGDHSGNYRFMNPMGMSVDINDTIYVADSDNGKIVKLVYNRGSASINYATSFTISGMIHPVDIAIDQSGSLGGNTTNDRIWIADDFANQLICIRRSGEVLQRITYYTYGASNYLVRNIKKIQTQEIPGGSTNLGFIDRNRMAFVVLQPPSINISTITYFDPSASDLNCIGIDINNEWWVGDEKMKVYHKFTRSGQYLASYNGVAFGSPVAITKAPYFKSGWTVYRSQYVFTSDRWGDNTGIRAFFPGAAILNAPLEIFDRGGCTVPIQFILTNKANIRVSVYKKITGGKTIIKQFNPIVLEASTNAVVNINNYYLGVAEYIISIVYGNGWENPVWELCDSVLVDYRKTRTSYMAAWVEPVPASNKCCTHSYCVWEAFPPCPEGFYTYQWYYKTANGWSSYGSGGQSKTFSGQLASGEEIKCRITNDVPGGSYADAYYTNCPPEPPPPPPPPPSCPFVYTWDGKKFHEDNNIIPQSEYPENIGSPAESGNPPKA
ncbi:MAG: hypothetical protein QME52_09285, partial [Bacteroidota bacterium]|nr:hypothetical protein [Bacteroidota bacterium]